LLAALSDAPGLANIVTRDKATIEAFPSSVKKFHKFKVEDYETTQEPCPMPEKSGAGLVSKMSASSALWNDSETNSPHAKLIRFAL
jgi:hypothetical protein